jgi:poly-gamma-glutamate synthase PgsB/CapB
LITGSLLAIWLIFLCVEWAYLRGMVDSVPLRICVTGTRGKSSVTRLITAALRGSGMSVLARTTGAKPVLIFPDGSERVIARRGPATILEGKKILRLANKLRVDACVVELMAIQPETIYVESQKIFRPDILCVTNVRLDHTAHMGSTKEHIAACFASAIPAKGTVFVPQEEICSVFRRTAQSRKTELIPVREAHNSYMGKKNGIFSSEFDENIRLCVSVCEFLEQDASTVFQATGEVLPDFGSLKVWTALSTPYRPDWYFVSAFAANEPESTQLILSKLRKNLLLEGRTVIGVLNLREDRGDRTLLWLEALRYGKFSEIQKLICLGHHAPAMIRKLKKYTGRELHAWHNLQPEEIMLRLSGMTEEKVVVIGMGNMGGAGAGLVDYWERTGKRYEL